MRAFGAIVTWCHRGAIKTKQTKHEKQSENHETSQECKVLKHRKPCSRVGAVHIYTHQLLLNSFRQKTIIQNNANIDPKMIEKSNRKNIEQMMQQNIENNYPTYAKKIDIGSHFGGICLGSYGSPWSDFVDFGENVGSKLAPQIKDSRATNCTNHTFKKNKQGFRQSLLIINLNKSYFAFVRGERTRN